MFVITECSSCDMPILDEECYAIAGETPKYLHVECYESYKEKNNSNRLDREFIQTIEAIYKHRPKTTQDFIKIKWRENDSNRYNNARIKELKDMFESKGPNGKMLNELSKDFLEHPNAIRIFIEVIYKHPSYRTKGYNALTAVESPIVFDLMLIELLRCLLSNDNLTANKMMLTMYELDKDKTCIMTTDLLKRKLLMPDRIYRNSLLYRLITQAPLDIAFAIAINLPDNLEWDMDILFDRLLEVDIPDYKDKITELLNKYDDNPYLWMELCCSIADFRPIMEDGNLSGKICLGTRKMIQSGRLAGFVLDNTDIAWSKMLSDFISMCGQPAFDLRDDFLALKDHLGDYPVWNEDCNEAIFAITEPELHTTMHDESTIFDDILGSRY